MNLTLMIYLFFFSVFSSKHFESEVALQFFSCTIPGTMTNSKIRKYTAVEIKRKNL